MRLICLPAGRADNRTEVINRLAENLNITEWAMQVTMPQRPPIDFLVPTGQEIIDRVIAKAFDMASDLPDPPRYWTLDYEMFSQSDPRLYMYAVALVADKCRMAGLEIAGLFGYPRIGYTTGELSQIPNAPNYWKQFGQLCRFTKGATPNCYQWTKYPGFKPLNKVVNFAGELGCMPFLFGQFDNPLGEVLPLDRASVQLTDYKTQVKEAMVWCDTNDPRCFDGVKKMLTANGQYHLAKG